jgi:hypothetical protein
MELGAVSQAGKPQGQAVHEHRTPIDAPPKKHRRRRPPAEASARKEQPIKQFPSR